MTDEMSGINRNYWPAFLIPAAQIKFDEILYWEVK